MTRCPLYRRLSEPQGWSGRVRKISHPPGLDLRTVQAVGSRYTEWAIKVHIYLNTSRYNWDFYWLLQRSAKFLLCITGVFFFLTLTRYVQDRRVFCPLCLDTSCLLAYRTDRQLQSTRMLQLKRDERNAPGKTVTLCYGYRAIAWNWRRRIPYTTPPTAVLFPSEMCLCENRIHVRMGCSLLISCTTCTFPPTISSIQRRNLTNTMATPSFKHMWRGKISLCYCCVMVLLYTPWVLN
jgi:hypothetical protein